MIYNDYRPMNFNEVDGQEKILPVLRSQSKSRKIGHSYLFVGHHGTGKTSIARILGRAANCLNPTENGPCNTCRNCRAILEGKTLDFAEIDAASNNGVEEARKLIENARYRPVDMMRKVYIIDEVHMLSVPAFNALLKTLEEPNEYCLFILCTTEKSKIPMTILSRCQKLEFESISVDLIMGNLMRILADKQISYEEAAVRMIAKNARGAMRDAQSILDQAISSCQNMGEESGAALKAESVKRLLGLPDETECMKLLYDLVRQNTADAIKRFRAVSASGRSIVELNNLLIGLLSRLIVVKQTGSGKDVAETAEELEMLEYTAKYADMPGLYFMMDELGKLRSMLRQTDDLEESMLISVIKICDDRASADCHALQAEVLKLKREMEELRRQVNGISSGAVSVPEKTGEPGMEQENMDDSLQEKDVIEEAAPDKAEGMPAAEEEAENGFVTLEGESPFRGSASSSPGNEGGDMQPKDFRIPIGDFDFVGLL